MKQETLAYFSETYLIVIAMAIFLICFIGIFIWTNLSSNQKKYKYMTQLPLGQGEENERK